MSCTSRSALITGYFFSALSVSQVTPREVIVHDSNSFILIHYSFKTKVKNWWRKITLFFQAPVTKFWTNNVRKKLC